MFVPEFIKDVILKLNNKGYEAYLVGGAVRDAIMEYPVSDYDLTTNASLDDLRLIFSEDKVKTYSSGKTVTIVRNKEAVEVTPFRGANLYEDLSLRDFTINAIAYDLNDFIDPFDGIGDIKRKVIKTPIEPSIILDNDITRIIRAIKFEARYNMKIDSSLKDAMDKNAYKLSNINKERIREDINKILLSVKPSIYFNEHKEIFFNLFPALKDCYKFNQRS
ncbi:MAG: CCA tRNA nucleotidyltransferase [Acholeplasmatales bacterium]|nr:CCA tRNA nucleotidyltransferase [Acholeplasmatales bacterium]